MSGQQRRVSGVRGEEEVRGGVQKKKSAPNKKVAPLLGESLLPLQAYLLRSLSPRRDGGREAASKRSGLQAVAVFASRQAHPASALLLSSPLCPAPFESFHTQHPPLPAPALILTANLILACRNAFGRVDEPISWCVTRGTRANLLTCSPLKRHYK